jgi:hypothetical protein
MRAAASSVSCGRHRHPLRVTGRNSTEEELMAETPSGVKTLAIRLPDELHAQLVLVAGLDGVSMAEAIRQAVETAINRRRDDGELAARAQAVLEQMDQEANSRRAALQALMGPAGAPTGKAASGRRSAPPKA